MATSRGRRRCVLVVEDDPHQRSLVSTVLMRDGYDVVSAEDGYQALKLLAVQPPDVIVLDLLMPGFDGWDVLAELRSKGMDTPIVVMTAVSGEAHARARTLGAATVLQKPLNLDELVSVVRLLCPGRAPQPAEAACTCPTPQG
jgi:DNA-binding response OmpR family regulator